MTEDEIRTFQMESYRQENIMAREIMELRAEVIALKRELSEIDEKYLRTISMRITRPLRTVKIRSSRFLRRVFG